jgi:hypothetical protein
MIESGSSVGERRIRRFRSVSEKRRIVELTFEPGASVSPAHTEPSRPAPHHSQAVRRQLNRRSRVMLPPRLVRRPTSSPLSNARRHLTAHCSHLEKRPPRAFVVGSPASAVPEGYSCEGSASARPALRGRSEFRQCGLRRSLQLAPNVAGVVDFQIVPEM